jgi:hypothetical protein
MTVRRNVQPSMFPDHAPDRPIGAILPSVITGTNADLIAAVAPLYLTGSVCDVTYGEGGWWRKFTPDPFTAHDLYKLDGVDFRALPEPDDTYDAVCFDPPYTISGSTRSSTVDHFHDAYGIGSERIKTARTTEGYSAFEAFIRDGLREAVRVSREWVLVKCMEFSQGPCVARAVRFHDIPFNVTTWALELDCIKHDQIVHHTGSGPGGHNIFDVKRARRNHSYLIVFRVSP